MCVRVRVRVRAKWVVLWSVWLAGVLRHPTAPVRVSNGLLRGELARDGLYAAYLSIPYATHNRFQSPGPEPKWEGVFNAVNENRRCPQVIRGHIVIGNEDCQVLNVFTPLNASPEDRLPVMVFIHGGGYYEGYAGRYLYGPDLLVAKGVVYVAMNYRLNIQGYLCLGIKEAPGNAGLKDQVAALRWIQRNIRVFGGDPDNVTIFGESAGASCVSLHLISPMSKGLFHKAILQSGSSIAPWAIEFRPFYSASLLAKTMLYTTEDPNELYNFLMTKTDSELITTRVPREEGNIAISEIIYLPCIEKVVEGEEPFLTETPYDSFEKGDYHKVPLILGSNSAEGLFFSWWENDTMLHKIRFEKSLPNNLMFPSEEEKLTFVKRVKKFYMGDVEISKESIGRFSRMLGEPFFNYPVVADTDMKVKSNSQPVYSYLFNYNGWRNLAKFSIGLPLMSAPGATHADDLFYIFKPMLPVPAFIEKTMMERMTIMWTNFAKYGDPTPQTSRLLPVKWLPVNQSSPHSLLIDESFSYVPLWFNDAMLFWRDAYHKYRRKH